MGGLSNHFQMIGEIWNRKDRLRVRVEAMEEDVSGIQDKARALKEDLYNRSKELRTMHARGLIEDIFVKIVPKGAIPRNPRTGKIRIVVDERK